MVGEPIVTVIARSRPTISVSAGRPTLTLTRPSGVIAATIEVPGKQGPAGLQGIQGPPGLDRGFGYVRYSEGAGSQPQALDPGVRTLFELDADGAAMIRAARSPFDAFEFWAADTLRARAIDDVVEVRVAFNAQAVVAGGHLDMECIVVGGTVPLTTRRAQLSSQANSMERVDFTFTQFSRANFVTNGARIWLTSSVALTLAAPTLLVVPLSAGG